MGKESCAQQGISYLHAEQAATVAVLLQLFGNNGRCHADVSLEDLAAREHTC
jgi:hypothetical protein